MINTDLRIISMMDWLENDLLMIINSCEIASSDASFRRYFRIISEQCSYIVMDAPPEKENIAQFLKVAKFFSAYDINVPNIYQQNREDGFLLLEDFGSECLLDKLNTQTVAGLYQIACDELYKIQSQIDISLIDLPSYDEAFFQRELLLFQEWFLNGLLDLDVPILLWDKVRRILVTSALEQPVVCVHRDYHSRNLMYLGLNSVGVIDFQDAVLGPITYDVVSLLKDCYITWSESMIENWMSDYYLRLIKADLIDCSLNDFKRWFDLMGMQRHLKAIGIFARLHLRDGKSSYLQDIPRTLNYIKNVCANYAEIEEWGAYLESQVLPRFEGYLLS